MYNTTRTILTQFVKNIFKQKVVYFLLAFFYLLLLYAAITGWSYVEKQNSMQYQYRKLIRKSWENNPDKHPHRMAHFGSFALRMKHPLSVFDYGLDNYAGNAVFLEAHKQNTVNFSEASFSTGMLRMGDLSIAMLLQIILPLIIFFLGFGSIASDKENTTIKIIKCQGTDMFQLLIGRALGLWCVSAVFFIPSLCLTGMLLFFQKNTFDHADVIPRFLFICIFYIAFYWIISSIVIIFSATSNTAKNALLKLLGIWLLMAIVLPRIIQMGSNSIYPAPSKLSFESAIEKEILKQGDGHNPNDPFFKKIKDSVLAHYGATVPDSLPVNVAGIIAGVGEKLSTQIYLKHYNALTNLYRKQNAVSKWVGAFNPFLVIRHNSMALAGTDYENYIHFQHQAETYRYNLAQRMNELQTKFISNSKPKEGNHGLHVENTHFKAFPDFDYHFFPLNKTFKTEVLTMLLMFYWLLISILGLKYVSKIFKILNT